MPENRYYLTDADKALFDYVKAYVDQQLQTPNKKNRKIPPIPFNNSIWGEVGENDGTSKHSWQQLDIGTEGLEENEDLRSGTYDGTNYAIAPDLSLIEEGTKVELIPSHRGYMFIRTFGGGGLRYARLETSLVSGGVATVTVINTETDELTETELTIRNPDGLPSTLPAGTEVWVGKDPWGWIYIRRACATN